MRKMWRVSEKGWCVGCNPSLAFISLSNSFTSHVLFCFFGFIVVFHSFHLIHLLVGADMESLLDNESRERI